MKIRCKFNLAITEICETSDLIPKTLKWYNSKHKCEMVFDKLKGRCFVKFHPIWQTNEQTNKFEKRISIKVQSNKIK